MIDGMASIYPPDYSSPVGQLRALLSQTKQYIDPANPTAPADYLIPDAQLNAFYTIDGNSLYGAAANALLAIATNEALVSKKIRTEDLQTDGPAVAGELRRSAEVFAQKAKDELEALDLDGSFEVIDYTPLPENWILR
jgi:hypothetical protein